MNSVVIGRISEMPSDAARRFAAVKVAEGYRFEALHCYANVEDEILFYRIRLKHPETGEKWIRPMRCRNGRYELSEPETSPGGKPLYGLQYLAGDLSVPVVVVEGESCVDALTKRGLPAATSGGASSAAGADWRPLAGRRCLIWPDADEPGARYGEDVAGKLRSLDCQAEVVDVAALNLPGKGADAVDWLAANPEAGPEEVLALPRLASAQVSESVGSPAPLPSPLPPVPQFDPDLLPVAVRAWCVDAADGLQVPLDFTAIPAMVGLAGVIGRRIGIAMKRNADWIERPLLWGCVVGRPSSGKSPALMPTRRLLERLAKAEHEGHQAALREYQAACLVSEARAANAKKAIQAALKDGDHKRAQAQAEAAAFDEKAPPEPRILVNDATVEKLGELLNDNPNGLLQFRDELAGWLASLDREGHEGYRAFWLETWNGSGSFTVDRIGRGTTRIESCAMCILGGMQPGKLAEYVRGAVKGGFADDGLIQRFQLAVHPDLPSSWRYTDRAPDHAAEEAAWEAFQRLRNLDPAAVGAEHPEGSDIPFLRFDDEAQDLYVEWLTKHMTRLRQEEEPPWMESHLAKYQGLVGRLALVLHLADGCEGPVSAATLKRAVAWTDYLEGHARRIYSPAGDSGISGAHLLLKRRATLGERFTARDVYRRHWAGLTEPTEVAEAIEVLLEHGHLTELDRRADARGRPSVSYAWCAL